MTIDVIPLTSEKNQVNFDFVTQNLERTTYAGYTAFREDRDISTESHFSIVHTLYIHVPQENKYYALSGHVDTENQEKLLLYSNQVSEIINSFTPGATN